MDAVLVSGSTRVDEQSNSLIEPVFSAAARVKFRKLLRSGLVLGAAFDLGAYVKGARFTALDEPAAEFVGSRIASRVLVGYAF